METMLDHLVVKLSVDSDALTTSLNAVQGDLSGLARAGDDVAGGLMKSFEQMAQQGRLSFEGLKAAALQSLQDIGLALLQAGIDQVFGGGGQTFLSAVAPGIFSGLLGRAGGGPVSAGQAYWVGEQGPELFMPHQGGQIMPMGGVGQVGPDRQVTPPKNINITINMASPVASGRRGPGYDSGRQTAMALHQAVMRAARDI
ncbi:MAG: hypothetical protein CMF31_01675 [Kordiimonas sp.]|nr:hypothetical protein [Kordiimonas sp.]